MQKNYSSYSLVLLFLCTQMTGIYASTAYYLIRSPGRDKTIQATNALFFTTPSWMQDGVKIFGSLTPEYTATFNAQVISQFLFGPALKQMTPGKFCLTEKPFLLIQGNSVEDRDERALFADYFYLPGTYNGQLFIKPRIANKLINADIFVELDSLVPSLYGRLYTPLVWTRWNLNPQEVQLPFTPTGQPAGYFTPGILPASSLISSFLDYSSGCAPCDTTGILNEFSPPIVGPSVSFEGLAYAQIPRNADAKVGLADVRLEVGYTLAFDDYYQWAVNMQCAVPTSGTPNSQRLFAARLGNNNWELGAGCFGYYTFWESRDAHSSCSFYGDANFTHLFSAVQYRTHDLIGSPLSRYMLAIKMGTTITDNLMGTNPASIPSTQFKNSIAPLANISTFPVRVSVSLQADVVALIHGVWHNWAGEIGYNLWARSSEHIHVTSDAFLRIEQELWAIKGDALMFGFLPAAGSIPHRAVDLSAAESRATVFSGTNKSSSLSNPNKNITAPLLATALLSEALMVQPDSDPSQQINTSINPHILTLADFDIEGRTHALTHKIFGSLSYNYCYNGVYTVSCTLGGFAEFGSAANQLSMPATFEFSSCRDSSLSQWSVFFKFGITFASSSC